MKVQLKLFLPTLPELIGRKELEYEFAGETVAELIEHLIGQYGRAAEQALFDQTGTLDPVIQVLVNGEEWITRERMDTRLREGDQVLLMMLMAGG